MVEPLERIVDRMAVVWGVISHIKAVKDYAELCAAIEEVQVEDIVDTWNPLSCLIDYLKSHRPYPCALSSINPRDKSSF